MTNKRCWHGSGNDEEYCWNGSGTDEKNIAEMEAGLMNKYCWNGSGIFEKILLKWKRDLWQNIAAEMEAGLMKTYFWNGNGIDEKLLLKWRPDWWKSIAEMEAGLMKNIAEFVWIRAEFSNKLILYSLRRIVRAELSCAELSGHHTTLLTIQWFYTWTWATHS